MPARTKSMYVILALPRVRPNPRNNASLASQGGSALRPSTARWELHGQSSACATIPARTAFNTT